MSPPAPHLVDEIHEEIFLRLPDPAALARASTACPRFRRIITDRSFLRRYRKRHPPPLLGFADEDGFHPAEAPHSSARSPVPSPTPPISPTPSSPGPTTRPGTPATSEMAACSSRAAHTGRSPETLRCAIRCHGATCCSRPYPGTRQSRRNNLFKSIRYSYPSARMRMRHHSRDKLAMLSGEMEDGQDGARNRPARYTTGALVLLVRN